MPLRQVPVLAPAWASVEVTTAPLKTRDDAATTANKAILARRNMGSSIIEGLVQRDSRVNRSATPIITAVDLRLFIHAATPPLFGRAALNDPIAIISS